MTRFGLPLAFGVSACAAATGRPTTTESAVALVASAIAGWLGIRGEFARECAQGAAYGDEERFPLKVPPPLVVSILPIAIAIFGLVVGVGPLLLADGRWIAGSVVLGLGIPACLVIVRSVHRLSRRWVVLVPAGLVIADPLTLTDPVLFPRAHIMGLGPADPTRKPPENACDLRLGAAYGSCALLLDEETDIMRRVRGRGMGVQTNLLLVAPTAAPLLLERARARRIHVRTD